MGITFHVLNLESVGECERMNPHIPKWAPILGVCRNPNLGVATKARGCKVAGQEKKPGSERKCEGLNPHTPKEASTLGVGVLMDFQMFKK
jgi:hypothetical protein